MYNPSHPSNKKIIFRDMFYNRETIHSDLPGAMSVSKRVSWCRELYLFGYCLKSELLNNIKSNQKLGNTFLLNKDCSLECPFANKNAGFRT